MYLVTAHCANKSEQQSYTRFSCLMFSEVTRGCVCGQIQMASWLISVKIRDVGTLMLLTGWQRFSPDKVQMLFQRTGEPSVENEACVSTGFHWLCPWGDEMYHVATKILLLASQYHCSAGRYFRCGGGEIWHPHECTVRDCFKILKSRAWFQTSSACGFTCITFGVKTHDTGTVMV